MAKITSPIAGTQRTSGFNKVICRTNIGTQQIVRMKSDKNPLSEAQIAEMKIRLAAGLESWNALKTWKKNRWSICAIATFGSLLQYKSAAGHSGYSLYIAEFINQNTPSGKQPVSPCSRRATDINSNPWDFTP